MLFGINNLDSTASSVVLERYVALCGIVLCTPLFLPEQDHSIREVVESKITSLSGVYLIRLTLAVVVLLCILSGFIGLMLLNHCQFAVGPFVLGTFATAFFLGSIGFAAYALFDSLVIGYMLPLGYYMLNLFSGESLGESLFILSSNREFEGEILAAWRWGDVDCIGIVYRSLVRKVR